MVNFRVIRIGDIVKNLVKVGILILCFILFTRFFSAVKRINLQEFIENRKKEFEGKTFIECLDENLNDGVVKETVDEQNLISKELDFIPDRSVNVFNEDEILDTQGEIQTVGKVDNEVPTSATTQVVSEHNKKDIYNVTYSTVQIRNQTSFELTPEMLTPDITFDKSNIVIFHTHTSESYTSSEAYPYVASGNFRTLDTNANVVGVGNELTSRLNKKNINVVHDTTFHDYPEYNGAYTRSLQTVQNILASTSADLVIDLHRDAIADSSYGPSVMIGEEKAAQLMFVMGSSEGGLSHPNWINNLKIAVKIQEKANEMYPGLFKPILLSKYRYNEHLAKGSCIIEVGATGNTMEECLTSMKYLAEVINAIE